MPNKSNPKLELVLAMTGLISVLNVESLKLIETSVSDDASVTPEKKTQCAEQSEKLDAMIARLKKERDELEKAVAREWYSRSGDLAKEINQATGEIQQAHVQLKKNIENAKAFVELLGHIVELIKIVMIFV